MTDKKYLITEGERDVLLANHLLLKHETDLMQSLPMVKAEPVAWQIKFKDEHGTQRQVVYTHNAIGDYRQIDTNAICEPLYTSPNPLHP